jgi:hypothetical protein
VSPIRWKTFPKDNRVFISQVALMKPIKSKGRPQDKTDVVERPVPYSILVFALKI